MVRKSMRAPEILARCSKVFAFMPIKGFSVGLEYFDHEVLGFGINMDIGIFRATWYKDVETDDFEDEE